MLVRRNEGRESEIVWKKMKYNAFFSDAINHCVSSPCLNGGTCRNQRDSFLCLCVETGETVYGGKTCEIG